MSDRSAVVASQQGGKHRYPVNDIRGHTELVRGDALRIRLSRLRGQTPRHILAAPFGIPAVINDFEWEEEANFTQYDTINSGEFSQKLGGYGFHGRKLKRLDLETLAMDCDADWLVHGGYSLRDVRETLQAILHSGRAFRLDARADRGDDGDFDLRIYANLVTMRPSLHAGQRSTRYYTLSFVEWRHAAAERRATDPGGNVRGGSLPTKRRLTATDTLHSLSKFFYGDYGLARQLGERNGLKRWGLTTPIVKSPRFKVGQAFLIPALAAKWTPLDSSGQGKDRFVSV